MTTKVQDLKTTLTSKICSYYFINFKNEIITFWNKEISLFQKNIKSSFIKI